MSDQLVLAAPPQELPFGSAEESVSDLKRICALARRPPVDCDRDRLTKRYAPATQALIEIMTAKFSRGARASCACRPRKITLGADGVLTITRAMPEGGVPDSPIRVLVSEFVADNRTSAAELEVAKKVLSMRPGEEISLSAADGLLGHPCISRLNAVQSWLLREAPQVGGVVGFAGVGSGKCCRQGTEIFDVSSGRRRLIEELGSFSVTSFDGISILERPANSFVSGKKFCCDLVLAEGSRIGLSLDHKVYTQRGWVEASLLTTKDFVAVPTTLPEPVSSISVSDDEIALVALMLADGSCTTPTLRFTDDNEKVISEFRRLVDLVCDGSFEGKPKSKARNFNLHGTGPRGSNFRARWGLFDLSKHKRVLPEIWGLPRRQVALFLNRFWACDGHVAVNHLECTLASEKLIDDIRFLLQRLGIRTSKSYKKAKLKDKYFDAWRIHVSGDAALKFLNEVGDVLGSEEACQRFRAKLESTKRNTNVDVVPIGRPELYEICDELGFKKIRGCSGRSAKGRDSRTELIRGFFKATAGQYVSRARFVEFCEKYKYTGKYAHLGVRDLAWERVVSVTNTGEHPVYDLTVPETENFVANGMLIHNSMGFLLAPLVFPDAKLAVLVIEPKQRQHYRSQYLRVREHFRVTSIVFDNNVSGYTVPNTPPLHLVSYSILSRPESTKLLDDLAPDVLLLDECHRSASQSAIGRRIRRFCATQIAKREAAMIRGEVVRARAVRVIGASGTLESKSVNDTQMLSAFALGTGSPLPLDKNEAEKWTAVIDPSSRPDYTSSTSLELQIAFAGELFDGSSLDNLLVDKPEKKIREGFMRRRSETLGVISASASSINAAIYFVERKAPPLPNIVKEALAKVRNEFLRPDGELLVEKIEQVSTARNLACGFYAYWAFPKHPCACPPNLGPAEPRCANCQLIDDWYAKRKAYSKELRVKLLEGEVHLDSPQLCQEAAERFYQDPPYKGDLPTWASIAWPEWRDIENKVEHDERVKWLGWDTPEAVDPKTHPGYFLARDAAEWALQFRGVVWFQSVALGRKIAEISGLPYFNGGPGGEERLRAEKGNRSIIVSISAHGAGTDGLQNIFSDQLIVEVPASNSSQRGIEQLFGRLHREGQLKDAVNTLAYLHVSEFRDALRKAYAQAEFNEAMTGTQQKLLCCDMEEGMI